MGSAADAVVTIAAGAALALVLLFLLFGVLCVALLWQRSGDTAARQELALQLGREAVHAFAMSSCTPAARQPAPRPPRAARAHVASARLACPSRGREAHPEGPPTLPSGPPGAARSRDIHCHKCGRESQWQGWEAAHNAGWRFREAGHGTLYTCPFCPGEAP